MNSFALTLLLLFVTVIWGYTFTVVKDAATAYGAIAFLAVRFFIGFVCLSMFAWRQMNAKSLFLGCSIGIPLALGYLLQTIGLRYTTPTNSGLITSLLVVAAPLFNRILFGVRTGGLFWMAIVLTMLGLVLLTGTRLDPLALGDLLTVGAAISFGLQIVLLDRFSKYHDSFTLAFGQTGSATILFCLAWPWTDPLAWPTASIWWALFLTGVGASALGFFVQALAQKRLPTARVVVIISLESVFAMFFGYILSGDRLSGIQMLGALSMLAAVALAEIVPVFLRKNGKSIL